MDITPRNRPCGASGYWDGVGCSLRQAEWLANVGIPLAATIAGLAVAYALVRHQIRHDRTLRDADRKASAVNEFGRDILRLFEHFEARRLSDPFWTEESWPGSIPMYEAHARVGVALSNADAFEELERAGRDLSRAWRACQVRRRRLEKNGIVPSRPSTYGVAMDSALSSIWQPMIDAGKKLVVWDGLSALPTLTPWPYVHAPLGRRVAEGEDEAWAKQYATEYERVVRERVAKGR